MEEFAIISDAILTFDTTGVETYSLIPGMDGVVVIRQDTTLAVVEGIFKFTNDVHENVHVGCALFVEQR